MVGNREDGHDGSGKPRCETIHNQHRRSYWHDYRQRGLYMVTMVIDGRKRLFGNIAGRANGRPGTDEAPHVMLSALGRCVLEEEVPKIHRYYPEVEVWRVAIMPDHIHLLLMVRETLRDGKHLGMVVRGFKTGCSRAWWRQGSPRHNSRQGAPRHNSRQGSPNHSSRQGSPRRSTGAQGISLGKGAAAPRAFREGLPRPHHQPPGNA